MGVCITAYSRLALLSEDDATPSDHMDEGHIEACAAEGFGKSTAGLSCGSWYAPTDDTQEMEILYWSYSGYNRLREFMSLAVLGVEPREVWDDPKRFEDLPLFELVHFSDCEGTIGPDAARNLLADFEEHRDRLATYQPAIDWCRAPDSWPKMIDAWISGLRLAADGGLVEFN